MIPEGWNNQISHGRRTYGAPFFPCPVQAHLHRKDSTPKRQDRSTLGTTPMLELEQHFAWGGSPRIGGSSIRRRSTRLRFSACLGCHPTSCQKGQAGGSARSSETGCDKRLDKDWEAYIWAGGNVTAWAYNGLLQGQFRHSEVRVSSDNMKRVVYDYTIGATAGFTTRDRWHRFSPWRSLVVRVKRNSESAGRINGVESTNSTSKLLAAVAIPGVRPF